MSFGELVDDIQCDNGIGQLVSAPRALGQHLLRAAVTKEIGTEMLLRWGVEADDRVEVERLVGEQVDLLADREIGALRIGLDAEGSFFGTGRFLLDETDLFLEDGDGGEQLLTALLEQPCLFCHGTEVLADVTAGDEGTDLVERIVQLAQIADRGEGIDLIEMVIAPPVCLVPYAVHQNPAGVIIAQQLYVHAENIRELSDGKIFFHTMHQSFQIRLRP